MKLTTLTSHQTNELKEIRDAHPELQLTVGVTMVEIPDSKVSEFSQLLHGAITDMQLGHDANRRGRLNALHSVRRKLEKGLDKRANV
jgi:hypothetical protein